MRVSSVPSLPPEVNSINMRAMASIKVLDMAQGAFEDVAEQLIASMNAAITGLGQNIDMYV